MSEEPIITTPQQLFDIPLHHVQKVGVGCFVRRVIGGWIYYDIDGAGADSAVFVPDPTRDTEH